MKRYLYRLHPTRNAMISDGPTEAEAELIGLHFDYLKRLTERGVALFVGRTTDASAFGLVVYEAESDEIAEAILQSDPAVAGGVMRGEWFPFRIVLHGEFDNDPPL